MINCELYHFIQNNTETIIRSMFGEHYVLHTGKISDTSYGYKFSNLNVQINVDGVIYNVTFTGAGGMMGLINSNIDKSWSYSFEILLKKIRKHNKI